MKDVFVVYAKRTAIGNYLGSLSKIPAHNLSSYLIKDALTQNNLGSKDIDEVILGQVLSAAQGQNTARQSSIIAGIDNSVPAYTINKVCGSGLKSIALAFDSILLGNNDLVIAGGHENMSLAPHSSLIRGGVRPGTAELKDTMMLDGLTDAFSATSMGITAENIAKKYLITRDQQDEFAYNSQMKASETIKNKLFKNEILPVEITKNKEKLNFEIDEFVKPNTKLDNLAKLKPAFDKNGSVTAGNSSGINDGAAIIMLASEEAVKKYNLKPLARVSAHASCGVDPSIMGIGPSLAVKKLMTKTGWNLNDLDIVESNEAFAAQAIAVNKILEWDPSIINITGGSIAIGHPIGASGARITVTLINNMLRLKSRKAVSTLCIGGGMGIAMSFENV